MQTISTISLKEARFLALGSQMLLNAHSLKGKAGLLKVIEQLGYVQIDTISVVERSHRHILWTRLPSFDEKMLADLIDKDKKVFEYWSHAAAFVPMRDFRFSLFRKRMFTHYNKAWGKWANKNRKVIKYVLERIKAEGPLQSKDFEHPKKRGTWWDWKPTKTALEYLFHTGKLMLKARKNFQKIYDLAERILPGNIITSEPTDEEHSEYLIMSALRANGIVTKSEMVYQKFYSPPAFEKALNNLLNEKQIINVKVEKLKQEYYSTETELNKLNGLNNEILPAINHRQDLIHILSPFDNLVIQRKRLSDLFNFDYVVECYLPAQKRKFGYFCLPVLFGDKFIGRIDAKADRAANTFIVNNFFTEDGFKSSKKSGTEINGKIKKFSEFTGCENINF
jgi:uncharacterized protein YcaQ